MNIIITLSHLRSKDIIGMRTYISDVYLLPLITGLDLNLAIPVIFRYSYVAMHYYCFEYEVFDYPQWLLGFYMYNKA